MVLVPLLVALVALSAGVVGGETEASGCKAEADSSCVGVGAGVETVAVGSSAFDRRPGDVLAVLITTRTNMAQANVFRHLLSV